MLVRPNGKLTEVSDRTRFVSNWTYLDQASFAQTVTAVTYRCADSFRGLTVPF